jgi:hypothetical protein
LKAIIDKTIELGESYDEEEQRIQLIDEIDRFCRPARPLADFPHRHPFMESQMRQIPSLMGLGWKDVVIRDLLLSLDPRLQDKWPQHELNMPFGGGFLGELSSISGEILGACPYGK